MMDDKIEIEFDIEPKEGWEMSENYSKADILDIAESMIEDLRECEDGTVTTTAKLARTCDYDDMETSDLFDLHHALLRAARANHITLDMLEHKDKAEGLPFNLEFIVKNKRAQIKCPHCGSTNTARYIYGLPYFDEEMRQNLDNGKWVLGGCRTSSVNVNGQDVEIIPRRKCNDCKKNFGTEPILISSNYDTGEDYRDIVTCIRFSVGGYFGGFTSITIKKNDNGALVNVQKTLETEKIPEDRQITVHKWQMIVNTLYKQMYLHEWRKRFVDPRVLDGTHWSLDVLLSSNRKRSYSGINDYPAYWSELLKIFRKFAKM